MFGSGDDSPLCTCESTSRSNNVFNGSQWPMLLLSLLRSRLRQTNRSWTGLDGRKVLRRPAGKRDSAMDALLKSQARVGSVMTIGREHGRSGKEGSVKVMR